MGVKMLVIACNTATSAALVTLREHFAPLPVMGLYEGGGRFILFVFTIATVIFIVVTFIRWIDRLTTLGRVNETNGLIEKAATKALTLRAHKPTYGCNRLEIIPDSLSEENTVKADSSGYLQYFDAKKLSSLAEEHG